MTGENLELPETRSLEERLRPLCGPLHPAVMRLVVSETVMAVACDGSMALALVGDCGADVMLREEVRTGLTKMLEAVPEEPRIETTVEKLLAWTGQPVWSFPCDTCDGTGQTPAMLHCSRCEGNGTVDCYCSDCGDDHEKECPQCDGDGETVAEAGGETQACEDCRGSGTLTDPPTAEDGDAGVIFSMVLDRRRLARLLSCASGSCVVWVHRTASGPPESQRLHLRGFGWRAVLMGMRREMDGVVRFDPDL